MIGVMRTTLTLDPDVAAMLKKTVAAGKVSFKDAVNAALRVGLAQASEPAKPRKRFVQRVGSPAEFLIDVSDNAAMYEMWDREDYPDLFRHQPAPVRDESS